jgi:hypothetical protein
MSSRNSVASKRRCRLAVVAALAIGAIPFIGQPPASAACPTLQINLPAKVSIDREFKQVNVPLVSSCGAQYAASDLYGPGGFENIFIYDPAYNGKLDYWDVYDYMIKPGQYYLRDGHAYDASYNDLPVASDTTTVKYASGLSIATDRSGSKVKVTISARRYDGSANKMMPRSGVTVGIRERVPGTTAWKIRSYLKTPASGTASVTLSSPSTRDFQAWFGATGSFWDATSLVSRR